MDNALFRVLLTVRARAAVCGILSQRRCFVEHLVEIHPKTWTGATFKAQSYFRVRNSICLARY